jgi:hypothetical protein
LRRAKVTTLVGPPAVVVLNIFREHYTQVPLIEDQHAVGEFGSDGAGEQFARGQRGGIRTTWMPTSARTASKDAVNWPARSRARNRNWVTRSPRSITRLRSCCVVHLLSGFVVAQQVHGPATDLQHEKHVDPLERHCAVHMEKVARQHRRRLRAQELPPGRIVAPDRRRRYPQPLENAANRGRSHAVADLEQLALNSLVPQR